MGKIEERVEHTLRYEGIRTKVVELYPPSRETFTPLREVIPQAIKENFSKVVANGR